jgi:hypothetical protein
MFCFSVKSWKQFSACPVSSAISRSKVWTLSPCTCFLGPDYKIIRLEYPQGMSWVYPDAYSHVSKVSVTRRFSHSREQHKGSNYRMQFCCPSPLAMSTSNSPEILGGFFLHIWRPGIPPGVLPISWKAHFLTQAI